MQFIFDKNFKLNDTMEKENDLPKLTPEEKLKFENDLLRSKLTAEFGMQKMESSLNDESENQCLKYLYNFESSYSQGERIKLYDFIGSLISNLLTN